MPVARRDDDNDILNKLFYQNTEFKNFLFISYKISLKKMKK